MLSIELNPNRQIGKFNRPRANPVNGVGENKACDVVGELGGERRTAARNSVDHTVENRRLHEGWLQPSEPAGRGLVARDVKREVALGSHDQFDIEDQPVHRLVYVDLDSNDARLSSEEPRRPLRESCANKRRRVARRERVSIKSKGWWRCNQPARSFTRQRVRPGQVVELCGISCQIARERVAVVELL